MSVEPRRTGEVVQLELGASGTAHSGSGTHPFIRAARVMHAMRSRCMVLYSMLHRFAAHHSQKHASLASRISPRLRQAPSPIDRLGRHSRIQHLCQRCVEQMVLQNLRGHPILSFICYLHPAYISRCYAILDSSSARVLGSLAEPSLRLLHARILFVEFALAFCSSRSSPPFLRGISSSRSRSRRSLDCQRSGILQARASSIELRGEVAYLACREWPILSKSASAFGKLDS